MLFDLIINKGVFICETLGDMYVSLTGVKYIGNIDRNVIGHKISDGKIICYVDAKIIKSASETKCKIDIRYDGYTQVELLKRAKELDSPLYLGFS